MANVDESTAHSILLITSSFIEGIVPDLLSVFLCEEVSMASIDIPVVTYTTSMRRRVITSSSQVAANVLDR